MRLTLQLNSAGDLRVRMLRDSQAKRVYAEAPGDLLVCSSKVQVLDKGDPKRVPSGFGKVSTRHILTRYAKQSIREAGAILDTGPRSTTLFLTGTLPGSTPDALAALSAWSGWCVQMITQWFRDTTTGASWFGVWEYQRRGALHIHIAVQLVSQSDARFVRTQWKRRWIALLTSIASKTGIDIFGRIGGGSWANTPWMTRTDAQVVEKSVGCYLSKYLSKGSSKTRAQCWTPPSAWWFCQRTLRKRISEARRLLSLTQLSPHLCQDLYQRVSAQVAGRALSAFHYVSPYDAMVKGLIGLFKPIHASAVFNELTGALRCLAGASRLEAPRLIDVPTEAYLFFNGLRLVNTS